MVMWRVVFTESALEDAKKISSSGLRSKTESIIALLKENPLKSPPPYDKPIGILSGVFTRRINAQHRLIYQVDHEEKTVKIIRMWTEPE